MSYIKYIIYSMFNKRKMIDKAILFYTHKKKFFWSYAHNVEL